MNAGDRPSTVRLMDAMRGVAAMEVAAGHARWLLWMGVSAYVARHGRDADPNTALAYLSALLRYGHGAVLIFFVVSGFAIHSREARRLARGESNGRVRLGSFGWRRLRRLWPPLAFAVLLTYALDRWGASINPTYYAGHTPYPTIDAMMAESGDHSLATAAGALAFLSGVVTPTFGTNGPLWSLGYEACYYIAYPAFLWLSWRFGGRVAFGVSLAVSLIAAGADQAGVGTAATIAGLWATWCAGAWLAEVWWGRDQLALSPRIALAAGIGSVVVAATGFLPAIPGDWAWGAGAWFVAYGLLYEGYPRAIKPAVDAGIAVFGRVGDCSYTLYVIHFPIFVFLSAIWLDGHATLPAHLGLALAGFVGVLVASALVARFVEVPFAGRRVRPETGADRGGHVIVPT